MSQKEKKYLPRERDGYEPGSHALISKSPRGINTPLPNVVEDDIVVNNIATMEFNYTEQPYFDPESDK